VAVNPNCLMSLHEILLLHRSTVFPIASANLTAPAASLRLRLWPRTTTASAIAATALRLLPSTPTTSARLSTISLEALLAAGAIGAGVTTLAVIPKGVVAGATTWLLAEASLGLTLRLIEIRRAALCLVQSAAALVLAATARGWLSDSGTVLLVVADAVLIVEVGLIAASSLPVVVLAKIAAIVLKLLLVAILVEFGLGEVRLARVAVEVIRAVIVVAVVAIDIVAVYVIAVDVVPVDIVPIDVGVIDVVAVVVVVAIDESVRVGNIDVAVVGDAGVMPAASPGVVSPSAATSAHRGANGYAQAKGDESGSNHCAG